MTSLHPPRRRSRPRGSALTVVGLAGALVLAGCADQTTPTAEQADSTATLVEDYLAEITAACDERPEPLVPNSDPCLELAEFDGALLAGVLFDHYVENIAYPPDAEAAIRQVFSTRGAEFHEQNTLVSYQVQPDDLRGEGYEFCVVHDSGAWALYDDNRTGPTARGVSGGACDGA